MLLFLALSVTIITFAVLFALQNATVVTASFLFWEFEASLALILVLTFILGILAGLFAITPAIMKYTYTGVKDKLILFFQKRKTRSLEKKLKEKL